MSFEAFETKMKAENCDQACISAFRANFNKLVAGDSGLLLESELDPLVNLPHYDSLDSNSDTVQQKCCVLKLNGGLGTSMGLSKAKSLLPLQHDETFLSLIGKQMSLCPEVPFIFMNSFNTSADTHEYMKRTLPEVKFIELMQNKCPKVQIDGLCPVEYPTLRELEWCPPGHGDLFSCLYGSGLLDQLLLEGVRYMFVSNADNLGATLDSTLLSYLNTNPEVSFLMEVCQRTEMDRKGGHVALSKANKRLCLRESAMCAKQDEVHFQNIALHQYFNTNNIWLRLDQVKRVMDEHDGVMPLDLIKNKKTVDPRDPHSQAVFQLETAMGSAISAFPGSAAMVVPRSRFAPVKTCGDLFALKSDAYDVDSKFRVQCKANTRPVVELDDAHYKLLDDFNALVLVVPSLVQCEKVTVKGPVRFHQEGVVLKGVVSIVNRNHNEIKNMIRGVFENETVEL